MTPTEPAVAVAAVPAGQPPDLDLDVLDAIQQRVLWLATAIVHAANTRHRDNLGVKVGGHQASSASMVSIMSALWFGELTAADHVAVKPHASPVLHAINYLLGRLDASYLPTLRVKGGLQSYPSRTKDPDQVDFSTGSVGIGATAPLWAAIAHRYVRDHFADTSASGRWISLLGDAELDEGAVWEAIADPQIGQLGEVLWVVDINRQSLDRIVPDLQIRRFQGMFAAAGWQVLTCRWGRRLQHLFDQPAGADLRLRLEEMSNAEYQWLLRSSPGELRHRLLQGGSAGLRRLLDALDDYAIAKALRDLGGHDINVLQQTYRQADPERPTVVFAYTIKGWRLPTEGHPSNHSALLSAEQMRALADALGADPDDPWAVFPPGSAERGLCEETVSRLQRTPVATNPLPPPPTQLGRRHTGMLSTQAALGRFLLDLRRGAPNVAARVVTVSPDVASSTNLGGWINQTGVWSMGERTDWFAGDSHRLLRWAERPRGQHIELGIAETNLVSLLGELGATWSRHGQPLLPIGTIYDAFVSRALEPWSFAIYSGGQSILIGTPSGVTLAPEGGAHQSITTPSIGLEQPGCTAWEPAFAQDLEWCLLSALANLGKLGGGSGYFRLSTRPIDQNLACLPDDPGLRERRRRHVLAGAYRIITPPEPEQVTLVGMGAVMPDVLDAAAALHEWGIAAGVVCVTSADLLFQALQGKRGLSDAPSHGVLDVVFPPARSAPIVTVLDGHPHTLAFLSSVRGGPITCLGARDHGQSADLHDSYIIHGIDRTSIVGAALDLLDL